MQKGVRNVSTFKLKVVGGDLECTEVTLQLPATLGRAPDASLSLMHPLVSRHHCELFVVEGDVHVRDLGSLNGTFVGSQRIDESPLRPGDLLTVGTVTFRADYSCSPSRSHDEGPGELRTSGVVTPPIDRTAVDAGPASRGPQVLSRTSLADGRHGPVASPMSETEPLRTDLSPLPPRFASRPVESRCEPS